MAIVHKLIQGGEQYLGFALARERAMRKQGNNSAMKYDLGDATVEIRIAGNQSFVSLTAVSSKSAKAKWVAYPVKVAKAFYESAAYSKIPRANRPIVERIPFVARPRVPVPPPPAIEYIPPPLYANDPGPVPTLLPCTYFGAPAYTPKMGRRYSLEPGGPSGVYLDPSRGWGVESSRTTPIKDEFGNVLGYTTTTEWVPYTPTADDLASPYFRAQIAGVNRGDYLQYAAGAGGAMSPTHIAEVTCDGGTAVFGESTPFAPGTADYEAAYQYILARHAAARTYEAAAAAWVVAIADAAAQNAVIDAENNLRYQEWLSETDAPMVAKKDTECDAWDAPQRALRKATLNQLYLDALAEAESGFNAPWLTHAVLSPVYVPVGPFEADYFITELSRSTASDQGETSTTTTVTYNIEGSPNPDDPDSGPTNRQITGKMKVTSSFGPQNDCYTLNQQQEGPYDLYEFTNFWFGDPSAGMHSMFPTSVSRGMGYLVTGTTTQRTANKFLNAPLREVALPEARSFDTSVRLPHTSGRFMDTAFIDGCTVHMLLLKYVMWVAAADDYVPVLGYIDIEADPACEYGNCLESNFISRAPAPQARAKEVHLESVVTLVKTNGSWSSTVRKVQQKLCDILIPNSPRNNPYENVTLGIPFAEFPDLVPVVRGMPSPYQPAASKLSEAFTDTFFSLGSTELSVPPAHLCTDVEQMRNRIIIEAVKAANLN